MDFHVNYLAVLAAAIAYFVIGALWHSPMLFGKAWGELMGMDKIDKKKKEEMKKRMGLSMALNFLTTLVTAFCMARFIQEGGGLFHSLNLGIGLQTGFWIWLGFIATSMLNSVIWEGRPVKLYLINVGYYLVSFLAVGTILALWQ